MFIAGIVLFVASVMLPRTHSNASLCKHWYSHLVKIISCARCDNISARGKEEWRRRECIYVSLVNECRFKLWYKKMQVLSGSFREKRCHCEPKVHFPLEISLDIWWFNTLLLILQHVTERHKEMISNSLLNICLISCVAIIGLMVLLLCENMCYGGGKNRL